VRCLTNVLGIAAWLACACAADAAAPVRDEVAPAESKEIYLVFAPAAGELQLRLQGVTLRTFPAVATAIAPRSGRAAWPAVTFSLRDGVPTYERPVITAPAPGAGGADVGVTPEDLVSGRDQALAAMPDRYRLRFEPSLDVLVDGSGADSGGPGSWMQAVGRGLGRLVGHGPRTTLALRMSAADARRLALALKPGMILLILPEDEPRSP